MPRPKKPIPDRVLSPREAAAVARVGTDILRRWEKQGIVRSLRTATGRHRRYLESEVLAAVLTEQRNRQGNARH